MKHLRYLLILLLPYSGITQETVPFLNPIRAIVKEKGEYSFKVGDSVTLTSLTSLNVNGGKLLSFTFNDLKGFQHTFEYKYLKNLEFEQPNSISEKWQQILLKNGVYENIVKNSMQYDLRNDLNEDAIYYVKKLKQDNRIFSDPYFEDYLYTLSTKIHPGILNDGRPGNIYILIIKDTNPNAFILPNGTILISTGLLSTIQSEDELIAILAHEISHFVLDHQVININKSIERKKRAEFWSGFATVLSAGADIYLSSKYSDYIPGMLTTSTAILSTIISNEVLERLGIKYNQEQEFEADKVAAEIIDYIKGDRIGLSAALMRLKQYSIISGDYASLYDSKTHPSLDARIRVIGKVNNLDNYKQPEYFKKVSIINSYNAWIQLWLYAKHLNAIELANRNILSDIGTETDLIVKAVVLRRLNNTKESNEEVIALLDKAKKMNVIPNKVIPREEALTLLRLNRKSEAKTALSSYLSILQEELKTNSCTYANELEDEITWTRTMIYKIDNL